MNAPIEELKVRARVRLNAARREGRDEGLRLKDALNAVAREVGFQHFEHARRVFAGEAQAGEDMGRFWYGRRCGLLLNVWVAQEAQARAAHAADPGSFLVPYRRQYIIVQDEFIRELAMDPADAAWAACGRDLVGGYGSAAWLALCAQRLRAPAEG